MMRTLLLVLFVSLALGYPVAYAQIGEETPPTSANPVSSVDTPWDQAYAKARADMVAGRFEVAWAQFQSLVHSSPDSSRRLLATEMMGLCMAWTRGGLVLTTPQNLVTHSPRLLEDRRTTDEISVLYFSSVLYGLYSGIVADVLYEPESPSGAVLPPLVLAAASAGVVRWVDKRVGFRYGAAHAVVSGLFIGLEEAYAWILWHEASSPWDKEWGEKTALTLSWGMGTAGAVLGGVLGQRLGTTPGRASLMHSGAIWSSLVMGTFTAALADNDDPALLTAAISLNAGVLGAFSLGLHTSPSVARIRFLDLGGISGGLLLGGLYMAFRDRDTEPRGLLTALSLGMTAGLVSAWYLTRDMEPDLPRSRSMKQATALHILPTLIPANQGKGALIGFAGIL